MMAFWRFIKDLFTKDPWRKSGAIALALLLWYYVNQKITGTIEYTMEIRPTRTKNWESETGVLYVQVPKDRVLALAYPKITVILEGPNYELASLSPQLTAFCDPGEDKFEKTQVPLSALHWDPPRVSRLVKGPKVINLNFEFTEKYSLTLLHDQLDIRGEPPDKTKLLRDQIEFFPTSITLKGPQKAINKVKARFYPNLFAPVQISKTDTRSFQRFSLELNPALIKDGVSLEDKNYPIAQIPFVPVQAPPLPFKARIYPIASGDRAKFLLENYRLLGANDEGWVEENWVAEFPAGLEGEITPAWIQNKVRFTVDLGNIKEGPEEIQSFPLKVNASPVETQDPARFSSILFHPQDPFRNQIVAEKRKAKNDG